MAESAAVSTGAVKGRETFDPGTLKEYEPLTDLLSQIPKKVVLSSYFTSTFRQGSSYRETREKLLLVGANFSLF